MTFFGLTYVLLWGLVAVETLALVLVLREIGILYLARREAFTRGGPPLDHRSPVISARAIDGSRRSLADLNAEWNVLVFGAFGCRFCGPAVEMVERWGERVTEIGAVLLAEEPENLAELDEFEHVSELWLLQRGEILRRFGVRASPYAIIIDRQGRALAKGIASNHRDIKRLLREARDHRALFPDDAADAVLAIH